VIVSRDNEKLKLVRKLADRRWRDKLGLFVVEGEDLVEAGRVAAIEPVELLVAGENVEAALLAEVSALAYPPRVIGVYRREDRPWLPHVTVARFRERPRLRLEPPAMGTFVPSDAAAYLSRLHPKGARYVVLESVALGG